MTDRPRDELAEAIGRVAVAASHADLAVRNTIGSLGGGGAAVLAAEQSSVSRLIDWCVKFKNKLHTPDEEVSRDFDAQAERLKALLRRRNTVIHGLWFQGEGDSMTVSMRRGGKVGNDASEISVDEVYQLAQDLKNATWDFTEFAHAIAHPGWPGFPARHGDVH